MTDDTSPEQEKQDQPESQEGEAASELSEKMPDADSGEDDTPLGDTDQHSDAPGPTGTG